MTILAVDTSGPALSVAVSVDGRLISEGYLNRALTHSETLMPMLDDMLSKAGLDITRVELFACVAGPGSFTGVRIGVCAVRALAHATGKRCVRLNALEVLTVGAGAFPGVICPILDARRGQVYSAAFESRGEACVRLLEDQALPLEDFVRTLPDDRPLLFVGDGVAVHARAIRAILGARAHFAPMHLSELRAGAACHLAGLRAEEADSAEALTPIYLRLPQAERELKEKSHG